MTAQDLKTPSNSSLQVRCRMLLNHEAKALRRPHLCISAGFAVFEKSRLAYKQLFDHAGTIEITTELKVPDAVKVPPAVENRNGASCLLEWIA